MSPKIGAMTIQVFQDQVDGLARVFGPPALGALPAQRSLEALERRSDLVELLRRGVFLFEPENSAQTVKQIGAFGRASRSKRKGGWSFSSGRSMRSRVSSALRTWASAGGVPRKVRRAAKRCRQRAERSSQARSKGKPRPRPSA